MSDADDLACGAQHPLAPLLALEDVSAQAVDRLALLVHDVVVLEEVLADLEVAAFDLLLGPLDRARDHAATRWGRPPPCRGASSTRAGGRRRRCASGRPRARGRSARSPGRPGGRSGRAAGCRCAAPRAARCRGCAGRRRCEHLLPLLGALHLVAASSACAYASGSLSGSASALASPSGLPPRMMSVPRPAMLVAMVTAP